MSLPARVPPAHSSTFSDFTVNFDTGIKRVDGNGNISTGNQVGCRLEQVMINKRDGGYTAA